LPGPKARAGVGSMKPIHVGRITDFETHGPARAEVIIHPETLGLDDFLRSDAARMIVSVAHCLKSPACESRKRIVATSAASVVRCPRSGDCARGKSIAFRIETTNDRLLGFLEKQAERYDWIIGVACPFEIKNLAPCSARKFHLRQLIVRSGLTCPKRGDTNQRANGRLDSGPTRI